MFGEDEQVSERRADRPKSLRDKDIESQNNERLSLKFKQIEKKQKKKII